MPVIRNVLPSSELRIGVAEIVAELSHELLITSGPDDPFRQPAIFEHELSTITPSFRVAVVWDKWKLIPAGDRSDAVLQAYRVTNPEKADRILIAIAATTDEAVSLGLLPYQILYIGRDQAGRSDVDRMMRAEGASLTERGVELWLPTLVLAKSAIARLKKQTSPDDWTIERLHRPGIDVGTDW